MEGKHPLMKGRLPYKACQMLYKYWASDKVIEKSNIQYLPMQLNESATGFIKISLTRTFIQLITK